MGYILLSACKKKFSKLWKCVQVAHTVCDPEAGHFRLPLKLHFIERFHAPVFFAYLIDICLYNIWDIFYLVILSDIWNDKTWCSQGYT